MTNHDVELQIEQWAADLDREGRSPLYQQIVEQLAGTIQRGPWSEGQVLPTQKRLAKLLCVSEMTVRRALSDLVRAGLLVSRRGSGTVVATGCGGGAPSASLTKSKAQSHALRIGLVFASVHDGYPFIQPILEALQTPGNHHAGDSVVQTQVFYLPPEESDPQAIRRQLPLDDLDGLILMSPTNAGLLWLCQRERLAYVLFFNDVSDGVSTCITCDYFTGILQAVASMTALGLQHPALVTAGPMRYSTGQMVQALCGACQMYGLAFPETATVHADYTQQRGHDATEQLLASSQPPDMIFYSSDHLACGGLIAAKAAGRRVPQDLALIGAGPPLGAMQWPEKISTIDLSLGAMSRLAVSAIREQQVSQRFVPQRLIVRSGFVPGETT